MSDKCKGLNELICEKQKAMLYALVPKTNGQTTASQKKGNNL